jgi:hypothetical protein
MARSRKSDQRDSEFRELSDDQVSALARDQSLPAQLRRRYQREEKARGLRNIQKRRSS